MFANWGPTVDSVIVKDGKALLVKYTIEYLFVDGAGYDCDEIMQNASSY